MTQTKKKISRYPVPEINELPEDIQQILTGAQEKFGFVPNVLLALAHRPKELKAFLDYNDALMNKESGLTPADREIMILAFSGYNGCVYCCQSHGATLRMVSGNPYVADQVAVNYREADITPRQRAMVDFAMKVTKESAAICEADFETLRAHGFSDEDIWDIAGITAFYNLSNRMMTFLAVHPDEQFYMMGRH